MRTKSAFAAAAPATALLWLLAVPPSAAAADYLPLANGNRWVYKASNGQTMTIRVGVPAMLGGHTYHRVIGYASKPLWVRRDTDATLYAIDEDNNREVQLNAFVPTTLGRYTTFLWPCETDGAPQERPVEYEGPTGRFAAALRIDYRTLNCPDNTLDQELYLDNIGLARRVVGTFAGPVTYELVEARVGKMTLYPNPNVSLRLAFPQAPLLRRTSAEAVDLKASLILNVDMPDAVRLLFSTGQRYDLIVRRAGSGEVVHRWSDGMAFPQAQGEETVLGERAWTIESRFQPPEDGLYEVEAWLTTADAERRLAVSALVRIQSEIQPAGSVN